MMVHFLFLRTYSYRAYVSMAPDICTYIHPCWSYEYTPLLSCSHSNFFQTILLPLNNLSPPYIIYNFDVTQPSPTLVALLRWFSRFLNARLFVQTPNRRKSTLQNVKMTILHTTQSDSVRTPLHLVASFRRLSFMRTMLRHTIAMFAPELDACQMIDIRRSWLTNLPRLRNDGDRTTPIHYSEIELQREVCEYLNRPFLVFTRSWEIFEPTELWNGRSLFFSELPRP